MNDGKSKKCSTELRTLEYRKRYYLALYNRYNSQNVLVKSQRMPHIVFCFNCYTHYNLRLTE